MKIDLYRNKEIAEDENPYEKKISSNDVYDYIVTKIDFVLNEQTWICIDQIFSEIWNTKIGLGGDIYMDEIEDEVIVELKKQRIFVPDNYVKKVVNLILEYIDQIGGIME